MNKMKKLISSPITTGIVLATACGLLVFSSVGGARATLTYFSETYASQVEMHDIGVSLLENGNDVSNRDYISDKADGTWNEHTGALLTHMLNTPTQDNPNAQEDFALGKNYEEVLQVQNTGLIDTYVRVSVYKYWQDSKGNKTRVLDPSLIELNFTNLTGQGEGCWIEDASAKTDERTVLYYNKILKQGEVSPCFTDAIKINGNIASHVTTYEKDGITYCYYDFNGYQFVLEATVDSVQDHNAEQAILSAWGKNVTINNGTLGLK